MTVDVYTTGKAAKLLRMSPRSVCKLIDQGHLRGYRIPGSLDRRTTRQWIEEFLAKNGMPPFEEMNAGLAD